MGLEDTEDLVSGDETDLGDAMGVTEGDTDLRRGQTLASKLDDVVNDIVRGGFQPCWRGSAIRQSGGRWAIRSMNC